MVTACGTSVEVVPLLSGPRERKPSVCMLFGGWRGCGYFGWFFWGGRILRGSVLTQCECGRGGTSVKVVRP